MMLGQAIGNTHFKPFNKYMPPTPTPSDIPYNLNENDIVSLKAKLFEILEEDFGSAGVRAVSFLLPEIGVEGMFRIAKLYNLHPATFRSK